MHSCNKKRFKTWEQARDRRIELEAPTLRIYPCDDCGGFHFTSMPRKSFVNMRESIKRHKKEEYKQRAKHNMII